MRILIPLQRKQNRITLKRYNTGSAARKSAVAWNKAVEKSIIAVMNASDLPAA